MISINVINLPIKPHKLDCSLFKFILLADWTTDIIITLLGTKWAFTQQDLQMFAPKLIKYQ